MIGAWQRVLVLAPHTDDGEFGGVVGRRVEGAGGNREVPPAAILGACAEACSEKEGGSWGKHGFPHANSPSERWT